MKTETLNIFKIAKKIAKIAKGDSKESLTIEIVKLMICIQIDSPVYVLYNKDNKMVYITLSYMETMCEISTGYKLIMTIEKSKELNMYKITNHE